MNKEFVPYEEALALKELGFDEPCFGYYYRDDESSKDWHFHYCEKIFEKSYYPDSGLVLAPLYQQAFSWFREQHKLFAEICLWGDGIGYTSAIKRNEMPDVFIAAESINYKTYEEAELACLRKLIEIVNQNKDERN